MEDIATDLEEMEEEGEDVSEEISEEEISKELDRGVLEVDKHNITEQTEETEQEVEQLQALYVKCLLCEIADSERNFVEGNQMGALIKKNKPDIYPKDEESEFTTKTFKVEPAH